MSIWVPWPLLGVAMPACVKTSCPRKAVGMAHSQLCPFTAWPLFILFLFVSSRVFRGYKNLLCAWFVITAVLGAVLPDLFLGLEKS